MLRAAAVLLLAGLALAAALKVHPERQAAIDRINSKTTLWKAAPQERFASLAPGAAKVLCGVKAENHNMTLKMIAEGRLHVAEASPIEDIPSDFDSATNWPHCAETIGDIRDQSACGCCWAFGAAEAASDRMCVATKGATKLPLSAQNMCFCASSSGCDGGFLAPAWEYIQRSGLVTGSQVNGTGPFGGGFCSEFSLPHCHHHGPKGSDPYPDEGTPGCPTVSRSPSCPKSCDTGAKAPHNEFKADLYSFKGKVESLPNNADEIAKAIMAGGPVECAFTVYSDFENYASGIYHHTGGQQLGGHAVKIVGFGTDAGVKYWKVANSWNPYWGEEGYFRIRRGTDECGIESQVVAASADSTWGKMSAL